MKDQRPHVVFRNVYSTIAFRLDTEGQEEIRQESHLCIESQEAAMAQWELEGWSVRSTMVIFAYTIDPDGTKRLAE